MWGARGRWGVILLTSGLGTIACGSEGPPADDSATGSQPIVSGTPVPNSEQSGLILVQSSTSTGSGTMITSEWVLTAGHVVESANFAGAPHFVNMNRGNCPTGTCAAEQRHGVRLAIHHDYIPLFGAPTGPFSMDVALVKTNNPFSGGTLHAISNLSTSSITGFSSVTCFGYGRNTCPPADDFTTDPTGILRSAALDPQPLTGEPRGIEYTVNGLGQLQWLGDSGGSCQTADGQIVSVNRTSSCFVPPAVPAPFEADAVSAAAFREWANVIMASDSSTVIDVNGDFALDTVAIRSVSGGLFFELTIMYGAGGPTVGPIVLPGFGLASSVAPQIFGGAFNNDPFGDLLVLLGGNTLYFDGVDGSSFVPHANVFPTTSDYVNMHVGDFDDDGFDDLEATRENGFIDYYEGSPSGLEARQTTWGQPTDSRSDGRFFMITAPAERAFPDPSFTGFVFMPAGETELRIEAFDGQWGQGFDRASGETCYRVYGDRACVSFDGTNDIPPDPARLIHQRTATQLGLRQNEWVTVYRGDSRADVATTFGGDLCYRLEVTLGDCVSPPAGAGFNAFKYRAVGRPGVDGQPVFSTFVDRGFTWVGRDRFFPGIGLTAFTPAFDTDFDATFTFFGPVGSEQIEVVLTDADADNVNDVEQPGEESIANDISYDISGFERDTLEGPVGPLHTNTNPSGDYFAPIGHLDSETTPFAFDGQTYEYMQWHWFKALPTNFLHARYGGSPARLTNRLARLAKVTSGAPAADWADGNPAEIAPFLPIAIGRPAVCAHPLGSGALVNSVKEAQRILRVRANQPLKHQLEGELLAAKLNVARAASIGEPLADALIYGTDLVVSDVIDEGDEALAPHCPGRDRRGCRQGHKHKGGHGHGSGGPTPAELETLLGRLRAINRGEIMYSAAP